MTATMVPPIAEAVKRCGERDAVGHLRDDEWQEIEEQQHCLAAEVAPRQDVGGRVGDGEREHHDRERDHQRDGQDCPRSNSSRHRRTSRW